MSEMKNENEKGITQCDEKRYTCRAPYSLSADPSIQSRRVYHHVWLDHIKGRDEFNRDDDLLKTLLVLRIRACLVVVVPGSRK